MDSLKGTADELLDRCSTRIDDGVKVRQCESVIEVDDDSLAHQRRVIEDHEVSIVLASSRTTERSLIDVLVGVANVLQRGTVLIEDSPRRQLKAGKTPGPLEQRHATSQGHDDRLD